MSTNMDNLSAKLTDLVGNYVDEVQKDVLDRFNLTADEILSYIEKNCPRGDGGSNHLATSFIKTEVGTGINKTIYISSKTKGRLVHLIELGFRHRSGKHVAARPFLRPAYDEFTPKMLEDIKSIIKGGKV